MVRIMVVVMARPAQHPLTACILGANVRQKEHSCACEKYTPLLAQRTRWHLNSNSADNGRKKGHEQMVGST
jgi:hypothetical protein